jgi:hypothetical protein
MSPQTEVANLNAGDDPMAKNVDDNADLIDENGALAVTLEDARRRRPRLRRLLPPAEATHLPGTAPTTHASPILSDLDTKYLLILS